jgi:hypothetical protein
MRGKQSDEWIRLTNWWKWKFIQLRLFDLKLKWIFGYNVIVIEIRVFNWAELKN